MAARARKRAKEDDQCKKYKAHEEKEAAKRLKKETAKKKYNEEAKKKENEDVDREKKREEKLAAANKRKEEEEENAMEVDKEKDANTTNNNYNLEAEETGDDANNCRGETASGRRRKARAPQIARAEEPQAQDARATKQARPQTKKE